MTLLELTVVILVMLSLITILFLGARAWKRGADRALCVANMEAVQKSVRGFCNLYGHHPGDTVPGLEASVIGSGKFLEHPPTCPGSGIYTMLGDNVPPIGTLYVSCSLASGERHELDETSEW